jgi:hypothetical protein
VFDKIISVGGIAIQSSILSLQEQDSPSQTSLALAILETWLHTPISCTCHSECALMYALLDSCDTHNCRACKHIFFQPDHIHGN